MQERPFACTKCGRNYISPSGLRTHWKNTSCKPQPNELNSLQCYVDGLAQAGTDRIVDEEEELEEGGEAAVDADMGGRRREAEDEEEEEEVRCGKNGAGIW